MGKRHTAEEVANKLRQAEVELSKGNTIAGVSKVLGDSIEICNYFVQGRDVLMWSAWDVFVLENAI
ncbi:MAG: hypothetical protein K8S99_17725 [Planctomycetes bacterium]|nr:hypothetical protein [Planctomycetota bacterium]